MKRNRGVSYCIVHCANIETFCKGFALLNKNVNFPIRDKSNVDKLDKLCFSEKTLNQKLADFWVKGFVIIVLQ